MHQLTQPLVAEIAKKFLSETIHKTDFILIGLVGSTGAGKNTVAEILKENDIYVIDADKVSHCVLDENADKIISAFQEFAKTENLKTTTGELNRKVLGKLLFSNHALLQKHESIVFPEIIKAVKQEIQKAKNDIKIIVLNAPTLHKTELINDCSFIIYVTACKLLRILRIKKRDKISVFAILSRMKNQRDFYNFYRHSDKTIVFLKNNKNKKKLQQKVKDIIEPILQIYK